jgi:FKBP-type peptidyl-prolyl cis-trans isomerase FkpA
MHKRFIGLCLVAAVLSAGCYDSAQKSDSVSSTTTSGTTSAVPNTADGAGGKVHKLASGLQYEDIVVGSGKMAEPGMNVSVHYTGWLPDGLEFDSSKRSGQPLKFQLGSGRVIQGWEEGIKGMRIGGKRKLTIPPDMAYGASGSGPIPPNATLLFDVELVDVQ